MYISKITTKNKALFLWYFSLLFSFFSCNKENFDASASEDYDISESVLFNKQDDVLQEEVPESIDLSDYKSCTGRNIVHLKLKIIEPNYDIWNKWYIHKITKVSYRRFLSGENQWQEKTAQRLMTPQGINYWFSCQRDSNGQIQFKYETINKIKIDPENSASGEEETDTAIGRSGTKTVPAQCSQANRTNIDFNA